MLSLPCYTRPRQPPTVTLVPYALRQSVVGVHAYAAAPTNPALVPANAGLQRAKVFVAWSVI